MIDLINEDRRQKSGQLVLDLELQDLLDIVSKAGGRHSISEPLSEHVVEGEALKKAWYKHVLLTLEKMDAYLDTTRNVELPQLRSELKDDLHELRRELKSAIEKLERRLEKHEDEFKLYQKELKDTIDPISKSVTILIVKLGLFATLFGFLGSGIMALIVYLMRDLIAKHVFGL